MPLKDSPGHDRWDEYDWPLRCKNDFRIASQALLALGKEDIWISERWRKALQIWTEDEKLSIKAWRYLSTTLFNRPNVELIDISWNLSRWLKNKADSKKLSDAKYFQYFDKLMNLPYEIALEGKRDPSNGAINHPVGILTESLFQWWYNQKPNDNDGLLLELKKRLDEICNLKNPRLNYGRVIVASNILSLFRVDPEWTIKNVLFWFKWENEELASMSWRSYLWSPRLHKGLLLQFKQDLLATALHYELLDSNKEQYARFMTYTALQQYDEYKTTELATTFNQLPPEALYHVASSLKDGLTSSGDKFNEYWEHRLKVFLHKTWPKQAVLNDNTVNQLGLLCLASKEYFTEAFVLLKHSLKATNDNEYLVRQTRSSKLIQIYPESILEFLDTLIGEPRFRPASKLKLCLEEIVAAEPRLQHKPSYKRLIILVRRFE